MKRFSTTNDFINNHVRSGGFPAGEVVEMLGYNSAGDQGAALWKSTGLTIAASQTVIDTNDIKISDASGNEFELVHIGIIDLNALGGTGGAYVTIATNAGLTWSQSFSSIPSSATINYDTVSDMINASGLSVGDKIQTAEFSTGNGGGGVYDVVLTSSVTPNGANIIQGVVDPSISFVLRDQKIVNVLQWGIVGDGATNNKSHWDNNVEPNIPDGYDVIFPPGTYLGHFITNKRVRFIGQDAILINTENDEKIIAIDAHVDNEPTEYNVTESTLNNGDTTFTVTGASGLFSAGDIGYLWDSALEPGSSAKVNEECVKIESVSGDVVTVVGIIYAHKGAGPIKFYHSTNQVKDVSIKGFTINPTSSHTQICCFVQGVETVVMENIKTNGSTGAAARADYCYDVTAEEIRPLDPVNTGSGQGYGLEYRSCTIVSSRNIKGNGCRHVYDQDSVYNWYASDIVDMEDKSSPVFIAHNGFTSYGTVENVSVKTSQYPVNSSDTGYGSLVGEAAKADHPMRNVTIRNIKSTVDESKTPNDSNVTGVYIRSNVDNVTIDDITVKHANYASPTAINGNNVIEIQGIAVGQLSVKNIKADGAGRALFSNGDSDGASASEELTVIEDIYVGECWEPILLQGSWRACIDKMSFETVGGGIMIKADNLSGEPTLGMWIGDNLHYSGSDIQIYEHVDSQKTPGRFEGLPRSTNTSIDVVSNDTLTYTEIQNRKGVMSLVPPGAGAISMNASALPEPLIDGQRLSIYNTLNSSDGDRGDITFPTGGTVLNQFVVTDDGKPIHVISRNGMWVEH